MIYLGEWGREGDDDKDQDWLVYHTGPEDPRPGAGAQGETGHAQGAP